MCVWHFLGFEARFLGSNPGEVDFFVLFFLYMRHVFGVRILVRSIFIPSSFFFLLSRKCNSIVEGCCLCCSINFYSWDVFSVQISLHGSSVAAIYRD